MTGNPKGSKWRSTPEASRKRKHVGVTLSDAARKRLDRLAKKHGVTRSALVEALIMREAWLVVPTGNEPEKDHETPEKVATPTGIEPCKAA